MKKLKRTLALILSLVCAITSSAAVLTIQADEAAKLAAPLAKTPGNANPLITQKFGADPYAMVYNGRVYVYMTNDFLQYNTDGTVKDISYGLINKISVISSDDMVNWTDHGEIPAAGANGIAKHATNSWAPAAVHKTINGKEKFFLYFADNGSGICVLTSDSPVGPWTDPLGKGLVSKNTPGCSDVTWLFDPAVLMDDDGSAYLYCGGGIPTGKDADPGTARVIKLGEDMISLDLEASNGTAKPINAPYLFEDSGINKYNGKYYYSYCSNFYSGTRAEGSPEGGAIAYMVSDNPMGPFTYVKTILKNPSEFFGIGGNNHHCMFEFKGQWYIAYHAQSLGKAMDMTKGYRSTHINKVTFDGNGVIQDITGDYKGCDQLKNVNPYDRIEAETIAWNGGIATEPCTQPGSTVESINLDVCNITNGDWTALSNVDFGSKGAGIFSANIASASVNGSIELHLDSADGKLIGILPVSNTGSLDNWKTMTTNVSGATGVHNVYMVYRGNSTDDIFKVDYIKFAEKTDAHELAAINATLDKQKIDTISGSNTANLKVTAIYTDGTSSDITSQALVSSEPSGMVSAADGVVTGVGYGTANLKVSYEGKTDAVTLIVKDLISYQTVKSLTIDQSSVTLDVGKSTTFKVIAEYNDGHTQDVTNLSDYDNPSPDIADVSNGKIIAKSGGTADVVVSFKGESGKAATAKINIIVSVPTVIAIEAETSAENSVCAYVYDTTAANGHTWSLVDGLSTKAMLLTPDNGYALPSSDAKSLSGTPRLGYKIDFKSEGTYYLWLLAKSVDYNSDSIYVGVDNSFKFMYNGIQSISNSQFKWVNVGNISVTVGNHELNLWGREDGLAIDRILLTTSSSGTDPVWPTPATPEPATPTPTATVTATPTATAPATPPATPTATPTPTTVTSTPTPTVTPTVTTTTSNKSKHNGGGGAVFVDNTKIPGAAPSATITPTPTNKPDTAQPDGKSVDLNDISDHWAKEAISKLVVSGAVSGYPDNSFRPDNNMTRAEFIMILVAALKIEVKSGKVFEDTKEHWARDYIATGVANSFINGFSDTSFGPDELITREQMALIIMKAAKLKLSSKEAGFTDKEQISGGAREAVNTVRSHSLIVGYEDGSFRPQNNATRAEAATVVYKLLSLK